MIALWALLPCWTKQNSAFWFGYFVLFCYLFVFVCVWLVFCHDGTSASRIALYYRVVFLIN